MCALTVLLVSTSVGAEEDSQPAELAQSAGLSASLRSSYWSSSRSLDDRENLGTATLWLRAAPRVTPDLSLVVDAWVGSQDSGGGATHGLLREAYLKLRLGPVDLRAGKQIIVWGRADRINPTDNLTPRDYTLLVPDDEDQRFGTPALQATYYGGSLSLTGVWLPGFDADIVPLRRPPPPIVIRERGPSGTTLAQGAVRLEQVGRTVDWSISYFDGFDRLPDLGVGPLGLAGGEVILTSHRIRVVGVDAATRLGPYGVRGEAAYTFTEDARGRDPAVKNPFLFMVVGGDRTFLEHLNVNLQYLLHVVTGYQNPLRIPDPFTREVAIQADLLTNQLDRVQHSVSLRVSNRWLNETLQAEVVGLVSAQRFGWALRPRIAYALTDHWRVSVGADIFGGDRLSFLGNLRDNTAAFVELRCTY